MITNAYPCTCFWHQNPDILLTYIIHFSCPNIVQNTIMLFSCPVQNFKMIKWLSNFSTSLDYTLAIEYDVYIWHVSPRVSCGDSCQIWLCFKDQKATFARSNTLLTEKLKSEALTLNVRGPSYLGLTRSISWLLMPWLITSPGHQQ